MSLLYVVVFTWIVSEVSCQDCREDSIRLVGGRSELEGRVEIFRDGSWGTVCDDLWGQKDASVVCRQLGFSPQGAVRATFGSGTGRILLDNVRCSGDERRLAHCPAAATHNCDHSEDAGVRCAGGTPPAIAVQTNSTDTSIAVSWRATPAADAYNVTVTTTLNTSGIRQTYFINTEIPSNQTEIEYRDLFPEQTYRVCVTGLLCHRLFISSCTSIQTLASPAPLPSPTSVSNQATSANSSLLVGVLGSIIALLVLLLIVAGVGLAYPRCIRSRVKDKRCLSSISQFLDRNVYHLTSNAAYTDHNQGDGGADVPPTYEAVPDPPPIGLRKADQQYEVLEPTPGEPSHGPSISQVTADIVAQHYEMHEATHPEHSAEPAVYEVPVNEEEDSKQPSGDYSRLQY